MGRIIVVEDNIIYSDFVCRLLESKGYPSVRQGIPKRQHLHLQRRTETVYQDAGG